MSKTDRQTDRQRQRERHTDNQMEGRREAGKGGEREREFKLENFILQGM